MTSNGWVKPVLVIAAGIIVAGLIAGLISR